MGIVGQLGKMNYKLQFQIRITVSKNKVESYYGRHMTFDIHELIYTFVNTYKPHISRRKMG